MDAVTDLAAGVQVLRFPALFGVGGWLRHGFVLRVAGVEVGLDGGEVLRRLRRCHEGVAVAMGFGVGDVVRGEQVHGADVGWVVKGGVDGVVPGVDGLATVESGRLLAIHVADCCAVFVVDPVRRAVALLHSGRRGSELGIVGRGIGMLADRAGSRPSDLIVQLSPCIRPPLYEVDFAAWIRRDARACGVPASQIHDDGTCTASDVTRFYSYRAEKGRTGRMIALLGVVDEGASIDSMGVHDRGSLPGR